MQKSALSQRRRGERDRDANDFEVLRRRGEKVATSKVRDIPLQVNKIEKFTNHPETLVILLERMDLIQKIRVEEVRGGLTENNGSYHHPEKHIHRSQK